MGPRIRRLRWCLGVGYLLPSAVSFTCKSGQTYPQGPERACSEGLPKVQWIEQIPSESGKIFFNPLVLVLHPFSTTCHVMTPVCTSFQHVPPVLSPPALYGGCRNPAAAGPLTSEGWTHLAPVSGSKSLNACLGISVRKPGR